MKQFSSLTTLLCALLVTAPGFGGAGIATAEQPALVSSPASQDAQDNSTSTNASGAWRMSFTGKDGAPKQGTLQLNQDGAKLSGTFQGERGTFSLSGTLQGNQVAITVKAPMRKISFTGTMDGDKMSGTTEQGTSWTATRQ